MKISFHTNLDTAQRYISYNMGEEWDHVPQIGSYILFDLPGAVIPRSTFDLEVVAVRYSTEVLGIRACVELHIPKVRNMSVAQWEEWMNRRLGRM